MIGARLSLLNCVIDSDMLRVPSRLGAPLATRSVEGLMSTSSPIAPGHIGLSVTDLDRSLAFYQDVLELELIQRSEDSDRHFAFLGAAGRLFLTLWQQSANEFSAAHSGLHHLAFQLPT